MNYYTAAPQNLPPTFRCQNHPEREGTGICVGCRTVVCVECATKIDRMNYCIRCLQAASEPAREAKRDNPAADRALGIPLLLASFAAAAVIFGVMGLLLAILRQSWAAG